MARKTPPPAHPEPTKRTPKKPVAAASPAMKRTPRTPRKQREVVSRASTPQSEPTQTVIPDPNEGLSASDLVMLAQLEAPDYISVAERRAKVARLRHAKRTLREIGSALGISPATVYRDLLALDAEWLANGQTDRDLMRARELADLQDLERQIASALAASQSEEAKIRWLGERRQIKARIASLMGLDAPKAITGHIEVNDSGLNAQERRALAAYIAASHVAVQPEGSDGDE